MPPKFRPESFKFIDGEEVPEHEERFVPEQNRDKSKWWLRAYDTFEGEHCPLAVDIDDGNTANLLARAARRKIEELQPTSSSGGSGPFGIQDRISVMPPEGFVSQSDN